MKQYFRLLIIALAVICIYAPSLQGDWLWDDGLYYEGNPLLQTWSGLWELWFHPGKFIEYYPIEETIQWLQWQFWQTDTLGYHITNLILHLINALLVWWFLDKLKLKFAWIGGLIFAVHPVNVESVAWIAELKNTLSLMPFLLAMGFYIEFESKRRSRDYFLALGFFLIAMLCKISMATFPLLLLLYAWWKRNCVTKQDIKASVPFFLISLTLGALTFMAGIWFRADQKTAADIVPLLGGLESRLACVGLTLSFYFSKCLLPVGLCPIYPQWQINPPNWIQFLPWPIFVFVAVSLWRKQASWGRHVLLGLGFFVILLLPFLGFIPASYMNVTWVMDHFLYIPLIGIIGLFVAALEKLQEITPKLSHFWGTALLAVILVSLSLESRSYASLYVNQETISNFTIKKNPTAWIAYYDLGVAWSRQGRMPEAVSAFEKSIELHPNDEMAHYNLGDALQKESRLIEAIPHFQRTVQINPQNALAHNNLGTALVQAGQLNEAISQYQQAFQIKPDYAQAHFNLGVVYFKMGESKKALQEYAQALASHPEYVDAHINRGVVLRKLGSLDDAAKEFQMALQINPNADEAARNLTSLEAIQKLNSSLKADPNNAEAHNNLGVYLLQNGQTTDAQTQFELALKANPNYANAHNNLGVLLQQTGQLAEAVMQFQATLRLQPNSIQTRYGLAGVFMQLGNYSDASHEYAQLYKISSQNTFLYALGLAQMAGGDFKGALAQSRRFLAVSPQSPNADQMRLWIWLIRTQSGQEKEAQAELLAALNQTWNSAPNDLMTKEAQFLLGQTSETDLFTAAGNNPNQICQVYYYAGMKRFITKDTTTAVDYFQKSVATGKLDAAEFVLSQAELKNKLPLSKVRHL